MIAHPSGSSTNTVHQYGFRKGARRMTMDEFRRAAVAGGLFLAVAVVAIVPGLASAQSIAGTVRDASGAVLPGVTVEASSPALIEKVRTAVSDDTGQYR